MWLAVETTIIWFLYPETKGPTLEGERFEEYNPIYCLRDFANSYPSFWTELGRLFEDENPLAKGKLDLEKAVEDDAVHVEEKTK